MTLEPLTDHPDHETLAYRRALGAFATGVCVITTDGATGPVGITVNSFASVSLNPRLVVWSLDERSGRGAAFAGAERFAIHVLPADDRSLAARFASGSCALSDGEYVRDGDGPPRLPEALARFDCAAHQRIRMGDHLMIVGRVEAFDAQPGDALTYFRGRYGVAPESKA